ncbi:hypothetical protein D3C84_1035630 [compost metagenome]
MYTVFLAQGKTAVLFDRQVVPGSGEIQGSGFDRGLVQRFEDRQRHAPGEDFRQLAAALVRQVQDHDDRQHETLAQRTEDVEQRLYPAGRGTDHNGFYGSDTRFAVHVLR